MKTILIATDFSAAADNASAFGVEVARVFNAKAVLYNAYQIPPVPVSELPVVYTLEGVGVQVQRQLADTVRMLSTLHDTPIQTSSKPAAAVHGILEAIDEHKADLVVVGMKSGGKKLRRVLGSTVTGLYL